jgi:hypothetical protein
MSTNSTNNAQAELRSISRTTIRHVMVYSLSFTWSLAIHRPYQFTSLFPSPILSFVLQALCWGHGAESQGAVLVWDHASTLRGC